MKYFVGTLIISLLISCNKKITESDLQYLNGYWEIEKVITSIIKKNEKTRPRLAVLYDLLPGAVEYLVPGLSIYARIRWPRTRRPSLDQVGGIQLENLRN